MPPPIASSCCPFAVTEELLKIMTAEIERAAVPVNAGLIINFRDESYSPVHGGYHPVEITIDPDGLILYITDFSYIGLHPYAELVKEIDFDFENQTFEHCGRSFSIEEGESLFQLWQRNFIDYVKSGIFTVSTEEF